MCVDTKIRTANTTVVEKTFIVETCTLFSNRYNRCFIDSRSFPIMLTTRSLQ